MFDPQKAVISFQKLSYDEKFKKVSAAIELLASKGAPWTSLSNLLEAKKLTQENVLDFLYELVMQMVTKQQTRIKTKQNQAFHKRNQKLQRIQNIDIDEEEEEELHKLEKLLS